MTEKRRPMFDTDKQIPLWHRTKWKLKAIWIFIRNISANIKMICQWIPILWNNWDWDHVFLLEVMQYKLKRMSVHIKEHGHLMNSDQVSDEMNQCAEIIEKITGGHDYTKAETEAHEKEWGELQIDVVSQEGDTDKYIGGSIDIYNKIAREQGMDDVADKNRVAISQLEKEREQEDKDKLFEIMKTKIWNWWD